MKNCKWLTWVNIMILAWVGVLLYSSSSSANPVVASLYLMTANIPAVIVANIITGKECTGTWWYLFHQSSRVIKHYSAHNETECSGIENNIKTIKNTAVKWNSIKSLESTDSIMVRPEFSWRGENFVFNCWGRVNGLTWCWGEIFVWAVCASARVRVCSCVHVNGCLCM